jgi:hypothetical protein
MRSMYPQPQLHLSPSARQWWETTVETYLLEPHHVKLLQLACEARDRCSVFDREAAPCWPPDMPAHAAWHRVRAMWLALLDVADKEKTAPVPAGAA